MKNWIKPKKVIKSNLKLNSEKYRIRILSARSASTTATTTTTTALIFCCVNYFLCVFALRSHSFHILVIFFFLDFLQQEQPQPQPSTAARQTDKIQQQQQQKQYQLLSPPWVWASAQIIYTYRKRIVNEYSVYVFCSASERAKGKERAVRCVALRTCFSVCVRVCLCVGAKSIYNK